jgi:flavodoxin
MADGHENLELAPNKSLYAYALTPEPNDSVRGAEGITGEASVQTARVAGLGVVLDQVVTAEWVGPEAEQRMRKIEWVGPMAVTHEKVVALAGASSQTFPLPFGTLFSSVNELHDRIESFGTSIADYFEATAGCEEWSVKGVIDRDAVEQHLMGGDDGPSGGSDYLRRRKQAQETRKQVEPWLNQVVSPFWEELVELTRDHRVLSTKVSRQASEEDVVFNWAFLVPHDVREAFEMAVDTFHGANVDRGVGLRLGGPWAPYSFRPALPEATS